MKHDFQISIYNIFTVLSTVQYAVVSSTVQLYLVVCMHLCSLYTIYTHTHTGSLYDYMYTHYTDCTHTNKS